MSLTLKQESCSLDEPNRLFDMCTCQFGDDGDYNNAEQMALVLRHGLPDHPRKAQIIDNRWLGVNVIPVELRHASIAITVRDLVSCQGMMLYSLRTTATGPVGAPLQLPSSQ
jgi:hypothetical protein